MSNQYIDCANKALKNFGSTRLKLDSQETTAGNILADSIFKLLQRKSHFSLARCVFGGSIGKATAIPGSDYDLVVFINSVSYDNYEPILQEFKTLLESNYPNIKALKTTRHSVQFELEEFEFDLVVAVNFVRGNPGGNALVEEQAMMVFKEMRPRYYGGVTSVAYQFSSCLVESHVLFMKRQSAFVHELARICKFWSKTLTLDGKISGLSTTMELVAVFAGNEEEYKYTSSVPSMFQAFQGFLNQMKNINSMKISFFNQSAFNWHVAFENPYLVEPCNPFNNLASNISQVNMQKLKIFATETLRRITTDVFDSAKLGYFPLQLIFEPQPKNPDPFAGCYPRCARLGVVSTSKKYPVEHMRKKFSPEKTALLKTLKMSLFTAIYALTSTDKPDMEDKDAIWLAYAQIGGARAFGPSSTVTNLGDNEFISTGSTAAHQDHDVKLELPFANKSSAVVISFSWN